MHTQLFGPGELPGMLETYRVPADRIEVNLFGVDKDFWKPATPAGRGDYVLSVGNDALRDYATLLAVALDSARHFIIVTRRPLPEPLPPNVELLCGSWNDGLVDDNKLRALYNGAAAVVVPLKPGVQPSGQSVTLQAMACGRPVILSNIAGLWDREGLRHEENVLLVPPGDVVALQHAIERLFQDPALCLALGSAGRTYVLDRGDIRQFAARMGSACERAIAVAMRTKRPGWN
jgi:glycosyltransferase involved in cell wall biosynthesis